MSRDDYFRYLPTGPRERAWGLHVTTGGFIRVAPGQVYPPSGHPAGYAFSLDAGRVLQEFQIHYIPRGGGWFESQHTPKRRITAGDVFLLFPGVWHRYAPSRNSGWDEYWVGFDGQQARRFAEGGFVDPLRPVLRLNDSDFLLDSFTQIIESMRTEPAGYAQRIAADVNVMVARLSAQMRQIGRRRDRRRWAIVIRRAKLLLSRRAGENLSIPAVADELGVGYSWLRRTFRLHTGMSLHEYHMQLRMNRARHLLGGTSMSVKEVSAALGMADPHYFCRIFRNKTAHTPVGWRRSCRRDGPNGTS